MNLGSSDDHGRSGTLLPVSVVALDWVAIQVTYAPVPPPVTAVKTGAGAPVGAGAGAAAVDRAPWSWDRAYRHHTGAVVPRGHRDGDARPGAGTAPGRRPGAAPGGWCPGAPAGVGVTAASGLSGPARVGVPLPYRRPKLDWLPGEPPGLSAVERLILTVARRLEALPDAVRAEVWTAVSGWSRVDKACDRWERLVR